MQRRQLLKYGLVGGAGLGLSATLGCQHFLESTLFNECKISNLPSHLANHELMQQAFEGIDLSQLWDSHFHLIGNGFRPGFDNKESGIWLSPNMTSWMSPTQRIQYSFYLDAACVENPEFADKIYVENLNLIANQLPEGIKFMLLAFDYQHDDKGQINQSASTFYVPNEYTARVAKSSERFEWIASIHPYRKDAIEALEWCQLNGAKAVKWLPPAMNIDPSSRKCDAFYEKLIELNLPLLTHAGEEKAVHSEELQGLSNPLLLRKPLEKGVKVIIAHCASLGEGEDLESNSKQLISNFDLFARLMDDTNYRTNCLADIFAINLINRENHEVKQIVERQDWHDRLLFATDYPLPGVMPLISSKNLVKNGLLDEKYVSFVSEVRQHNSWLYDFLIKRLMSSNGLSFSNSVFETRKHFI